MDTLTHPSTFGKWQFIPGIIGAAAVLIIALVLLRAFLGPFGFQAKRFKIRSKWDSVAKSCGLTTTTDNKRSAVAAAGGIDIVGFLTKPLDQQGKSGGGRSVTPAPTRIEHLPRLRRGRALPGWQGIEYEIIPARGTDLSVVAAALEPIAAAVDVHSCSLTTLRPGRGLLRFNFVEPVKIGRQVHALAAMHVVNEPEPEPGPPPVPWLWGFDAQDRPIAHDGTIGHFLVAGATGAGKSGVVNAIAYGAHGDHELDIIGVDLKGGIELANHQARLGILADTSELAMFTLEWCVYDMMARYQILRHHGLTLWDSRLGRRRLLIVDELAEVVGVLREDGASAREYCDRRCGALDRLSRLGRAAGYTILAATQRPSQSVLPEAFRGQMKFRFALATLDADTSKMILGGVFPDALPHELGFDYQGGGFLLSDGSKTPSLARAMYVTPPEIRARARDTSVFRDPAIADMVHQYMAWFKDQQDAESAQRIERRDIEREAAEAERNARRAAEREVRRAAEREARAELKRVAEEEARRVAEESRNMPPPIRMDN